MRKKPDSFTVRERQQRYIDKMGREEYLASKRATTKAWRASLTADERRDMRNAQPGEIRKRLEAQAEWNRAHQK